MPPRLTEREYPRTRQAALDRLVEDGLVRLDGDRYRTTRRWQGAMARAAVSLLGAGQDWRDLRAPIAFAVIELYGDDLPDEQVADLVEAITPVEAGEIAPPR